MGNLQGDYLISSVGEIKIKTEKEKSRTDAGETEKIKKTK